MNVHIVNFTLANFEELGPLVISVQWINAFFLRVFGICVYVYVYVFISLNTCRDLRKPDRSVILYTWVWNTKHIFTQNCIGPKYI